MKFFINDKCIDMDYIEACHMFDKEYMNKILDIIDAYMDMSELLERENENEV